MTEHRREDGGADKYAVVNFSAMEKGEDLVCRALNAIGSMTPVQQSAVGGAAGWVAGCIAGKVGRTVVLSFGGAMLVLQVANHFGYVNINWARLKTDTALIRRRAQLAGSSDRAKLAFQSLYNVAVKNIYLTGGFVGGFCLGVVV